jgi:ribonuclease HI
MIIYADGSATRDFYGWAWCASNGTYDYGLHFSEINNDSVAAEYWAVINALKSTNEKWITVVTDVMSIRECIKGKMPKKHSKPSTPLRKKEIISLMKGRYVTAYAPQQKDRGLHGWCHDTSNALTAHAQNILFFKAWWDKEKRNPDAEVVAFEAWSIARKMDKKKIVPPTIPTSALVLYTGKADEDVKCPIACHFLYPERLIGDASNRTSDHTPCYV